MDFQFTNCFLPKNIPENVIFDGTGGTGGRVDGLDGPEKCPLNFFKLGRHLELVYIYLYTKLKLSPTLWVSKFDVKLGFG